MLTNAQESEDGEQELSSRQFFSVFVPLMWCWLASFGVFFYFSLWFNLQDVYVIPILLWFFLVVPTLCRLADLWGRLQFLSGHRRVGIRGRTTAAAIMKPLHDAHSQTDEIEGQTGPVSIVHV
jgi:hypothetical protein